jgi:hypothetical protein
MSDEVETTLRQARDQALATYRTVRVALLWAVVLLTISVVISIVSADGDVLGSFSAYYHTATRSVFVGALMAIGMSLIAIRGTDDEELYLNIAGMLAPVVALVPVAPPGVDRLPDDLVDAVKNNVGALFIVGLGAILLLWQLPSRGEADPVKRQALFRALLGYSAIVVVGGVLFFVWDAAQSRLHYVAAIAMFVCLGIVALKNWRRSGEVRFRWAYQLVTIGMAATAVLIGLYKVFSEWDAVAFLPEWDESVSTLEAVEVGLFGALWLAQTIDRWGDVAA